MAKANLSEQNPVSKEAIIAEVISRYDSINQKLFQEARREFRKRFSTVNELVYDYGRSVVTSYSPSERGSDGIIALSLDKDGVKLYFTRGSSFADPNKILQGKAGLVRYVFLNAISDLMRPEVDAFIKSSEKNSTLPISGSGKGEIILKIEEQKARKATAASRSKASSPSKKTGVKKSAVGKSPSKSKKSASK